MMVAPAVADDRDIAAAIGTGDIDALGAVFDAGADPNREGDAMAPRMPVYLAAEAGRADMLTLLVAFGADIDRRDRNGDRPLDWAARYGEVGIVRLLVGAGAGVDPQADESEAKTPLVEAIGAGHVEVAHFLLDNGADPNRPSLNDGAPLHRAAALRDTSLVVRLLATGAAVAPRERLSRETPLHVAAERSTPDIVRLLVDAGAPLDARDWDGETALFRAARLGRHEVAAVLVGAGAAVDIPDEGGRSPLVAALTNRPRHDGRAGLDDPFVSTRDAILAVDLPPDRDYDATTRMLGALTQDLDAALAEAVWGGWEETARILAARGALGQARALDGRAALAGAFHFPGLGMFELISAATTNLSIAGAETLVAAASAGRMDIADALFAQGYLVDTPGPGGRTALLAAAVEGRIQSVEELHALGADPTARDGRGRGLVELMEERLAGLVCLAEAREASRAFRPTDHVRGEAARLETAYREILHDLGLAAPGILTRLERPACRGG